MTTESAAEWWGVVFPSAGQFRLSGLSIDITTGASTATAEVRLDVWPHWLSIAHQSRDDTAAARSGNPAANEQPAFGTAIELEMRHAMVCICAVAFTLEAFTNSVIHHQPHVWQRPTTSAPARKTSADGRIHQVWSRAFKLNNEQAKGVRTALQQIFRFRDQAVHPAVAFVEPGPHGVYPVSVHPRFAMFRLENADTAVRFTTDVLPYLLANPRGTDTDWLEWCAHMARNMPTW